MPRKECSICSDQGRAAEVNALLNEGKILDEIAKIAGASRSSVYRHSKHRHTANASQGDSLSRLDRLYARIEKLLDRAERRGDWRAILELSRQLTRLRKPLEAQEAEAPKSPARLPPDRSAFIVAISEALGFSPAAARAGVIGTAQESPIKAIETLEAKNAGGGVEGKSRPALTEVSAREGLEVGEIAKRFDAAIQGDGADVES